MYELLLEIVVDIADIVWYGGLEMVGEEKKVPAAAHLCAGGVPEIDEVKG